MVALDYTARIPPSALHAAGVTDVCRYLCYLPVGSWKVITKGEYDELLAAGINITLNWEYAANDWAHGESTGTAHGQEAVRQARALGYPAGCTIIGSADFDMTRSTWDNTSQYYARGFATAVRAGGYRPGVYGPYDVLTWVRDSGLMDVFWQAGMSTAWSGGRNRNRWPGAHIRQLRHQNVGGQDTDVSEILISPWGQTGTGGDDMGRADEVLGDTIQENNALFSLFMRLVTGTDPYWSKLMGGQKFNDPVLARASLSALADRIDAGFAANEVRDKANAAAIDALAKALAAGGSSVDSAAVIAHIDEITAVESKAVTALQAQIAALSTEVAELHAAREAAAHAEAAALDG